MQQITGATKVHQFDRDAYAERLASGEILTRDLLFEYGFEEIEANIFRIPVAGYFLVINLSNRHFYKQKDGDMIMLSSHEATLHMVLQTYQTIVGSELMKLRKKDLDIHLANQRHFDKVEWQPMGAKNVSELQLQQEDEELKNKILAPEEERTSDEVIINPEIANAAIEKNADTEEHQLGEMDGNALLEEGNKKTSKKRKGDSAAE